MQAIIISRMRIATAVALFALAVGVFAGAVPAAAAGDCVAVNDNFAAAQPIQGERGSIPYCAGTTEAGEPSGGAASVWFRWTAPTARAARNFQSFGVDFDSGVDVFTGTTLANLQRVGSAPRGGGNDTDPPDFRNYADFLAIDGATYYIRVNTKGYNDTAVPDDTLTWRPGTDYPNPAADFNGDGCEDLVVGAPGENLPVPGDGVSGDTAVNAGAVMVRYGCTGAVQHWHQGNDGLDTVPESGDKFGSAVAAGDFNSDGFADLAVGVPGEDRGARRDAGGVVILSGSGQGLVKTGSRRVGQNATRGPLSSAEAGDEFGASLASRQLERTTTGVPPTTHPADLFVGVPGEDHSGKTDAGTVAQYAGGARVVSAIEGRPVDNLNGDPVRAQNGGRLGSAVATGGLRDRGYAERAWIAGHPGLDVSGKRDAGGAINLGSESLIVDRNVMLTPRSGDRLGMAVAIADVADDNIGRLVAGAPGRDVNGVRDAGMVVVYEAYGDRRYHSQAAAGVPDQPQAGDRFGASLATGFFNTDTKEDIVVGVPGEDFDGLTNAGMITVLYSGAADKGLHLNSPGMDGTARGGDAFGSSVGGLDIDGDTVDEVVAGAPGDDVNGMADAGSVIVRRRTGSSDRYDARWTPRGAEAGDRFGAAVLQ